MTRYIIKIFLLSLTLTACGQSKTSNYKNGLTIDPSIKNEVEKHIENSKELDDFKDIMQVYLNSGEIESYENDSLILSLKFHENKSPFKSFYTWNGDTLTIDGAYGIWGGIGFGIEIINKKARLYHMLSSDEEPSYSYNEFDSLIFRLEVPCTDTKIVLSEIPDTAKKQIIYGYVEFKSENYYASTGSTNNKENLPRPKLRNNMKLYFKSSKLEF